MLHSIVSPPHVAFPHPRANVTCGELRRSSSFLPTLAPHIPQRVPCLSSRRSFTVRAVDLKCEKRIGPFHEVELKVRAYELDQYGVVNNAVYASYCEHGRHDIVDSVGLSSDAISLSGNSIALSDLSLKYLAPLRSGDKFVVKVRLLGTSAVRIYFQHLIFKLPNEEPILEAIGTVIFLDKNHRPVRIPPEFREKIDEYFNRGLEDTN